MKFIKGQNREQTYLFPVSLDSAVDANNEVRLIDIFVDRLTLEEFGFKVYFQENGRPAYHPADLLKLYIYGYLNRVRSSRGLEKECNRNIEVMWLLKSLKPDHNTISNFRRDNPKAIKRVFRETVKIAKYFNLIGGTLIAGDSTKFRAQNSKKNNFNQKKIDRHLGYIENKLKEYNQALAENDGDNKNQIEKEIEKQNQRKAEYKKLEKQLKETGQAQVSTSDPDSRQMIVRNNITEVAYNAQTTVDAKHNILIDYKVTNNNDSKAMGTMLRRAKTILKTNSFTALYDKGYHTGSEFEIANTLGIETMVAIPTVAANSPNKDYNVENFGYCRQSDFYTCPQGHKLTTNGRIHQAKTYLFKRYVTKACKTCPVKPECSKAIYGKAIQRSQFQTLIDDNKKRINANKNLYRKRQQIVEHPYGTLKRQWGFSFVATKKTMERASADIGFMMSAYNLRRIINIVGIKTLKDWLERSTLSIRHIIQLCKPKTDHLINQLWERIIRPEIIIKHLNCLYLTKKTITKGGF
ncbi:MAG: IS1182 family transposase [Prolixibacteraceae bacterium]|jgi:transposase|nr:IS1182 family transposase [Prolixibacteraceae bacterium]MBT6765197.1 IS1182 family transposase [Prolixibacteraceae bacterium]MBT6996942.1 IS1182 family transposase [Prolixibacteraceae bacterium]MBT7395374.1 IS1182 family transposase [Prolixibacteraceae bacterium]